MNRFRKMIILGFMIFLISCVFGFEAINTLLNTYTKLVHAASTNTTIYLPSLEKNLTNNETNKYYYLGNVTIQRNTRDKEDKLYYLFPDHLSSTRLIINKDQTETFYLSYYPYGNLRTTKGIPQAIPQGITNLYTNQKQDQETNLYYYHARYYNPQTAHFISADKAEGPNRYAYAGNNPIMKNDPSGNIALPIIMSYLMAQEAMRIGRESAYLWSSDLSSGYKVLGELDILLGHTLSNTVFAVNEADPLRGGTLSWNSGASIGERAEAFGKALGYSLLLSSEIVGTAESLGKVGSIALRKGALALYSQVGNKELLPAIQALRGQNYQEALKLAEEAWSKLEPPHAAGFIFKPLSKGYGGGVTLGGDIVINSGMSKAAQASLAIHEVSHKFFSLNRIEEKILGKGIVSTTQHYGRYVQKVFYDEGLAYLAEYAGGVKSLRSIIRGLSFSTAQATTGKFSTAFLALICER